MPRHGGRFLSEDFLEVYFPEDAKSGHSRGKPCAGCLECELHRHRLAPCRSAIPTPANFNESFEQKLIKTMVIRRCRQLVKNSGGFSIAELLTAVAVFGIVGAVAVPQ